MFQFHQVEFPKLRLRVLRPHEAHFHQGFAVRRFPAAVINVVRSGDPYVAKPGGSYTQVELAPERVVIMRPA
jgi:hypothetical protein